MTGEGIKEREDGVRGGGEEGGWAIIWGKRLIEGRLLYSRKYGNQRAE